MQAQIVPLLILALLQGLTEFLPVSSSGHLVLAGALLGFRVPGSGNVIFETAVHAGTLGAVVYHYRRRVRRLASSLLRWSAGRPGAAPDVRGDVRYAGLVAAATVPAALVGLLLRGRIVDTFDSPALASACLIATGFFLLLSRGQGGTVTLGLRVALLIGVAQAVAILPGCSRSGWTITTALLCGVGFAQAAEFSFILSIPAILGALALELSSEGAALSWGAAGWLLAAALVAFASGLFALRLLLMILRAGQLHRFFWYLLPAGTAGLVWFMLLG